MANEPIDELEYLSGLTVVNIGDLRVARGKTRRPASSCRHSFVYDRTERRIWCRDCEQDIDPFDAFSRLAENYDSAMKRLKQDRAQLEESLKFAVRSRAAKVIDAEWRKRDTVPACPHCLHGLFPEDIAKGVHTLGRDYALSKARRSKA